MILLDKSECIVSYSVNVAFFDKFNVAKCSSNSSSFWRTAAAGNYNFNFVNTFEAKDYPSDELFINCKSKLICHVKLENEEHDAEQLAILITGFQSSIAQFIKNNSWSYYSKMIGADEVFTNSFSPGSLIRGINSLKQMKPFEEQTDVDHEIEKMIDNQKIIVKINTINTKANDNSDR